MDQKGLDSDLRDARMRMRAYKIFMDIRAGATQSEAKYDDMHVVETRRVVSLAFDKPSGSMKKRRGGEDSGSEKKGASGGGLKNTSAMHPAVMKCVVYELDTSV